MAYPYAVAGWDKAPGVRVHPTPIYEMLAYAAIFFWLWSRRRHPAPAGAAFATYLVLAGLARFAVEFVRINPRGALGLSEAQWTSLALVACGIVVLARTRKPSTQP
jgi:phosphatidylglycerol:prolipoprotein diacylglycerol transferase